MNGDKEYFKYHFWAAQRELKESHNREEMEFLLKEKDTAKEMLKEIEEEENILW